MFRRFAFDVSQDARPGQTNHLAVWIARMPDDLLPVLVNSDGPGDKDPYGPYGFMTGVDRTRERLKDLKTPGNFSYDWAFNVWTLGIWKDVAWRHTGPAASSGAASRPCPQTMVRASCPCCPGSG